MGVKPAADFGLMLKSVDFPLEGDGTFELSVYARGLLMAQLHLLAEYQSLVQQHEAQFTPTLTRLQASLNETLHQLQQQEQELVDAQAQQLSQLKAQLATNARPLLPSVESQAFVAEVQAIPPLRHWNQTSPTKRWTKKEGLCIRQGWDRLKGHAKSRVVLLNRLVGLLSS
jgi:hypothetical protein